MPPLACQPKRTNCYTKIANVVATIDMSIWQSFYML